MAFQLLWAAKREAERVGVGFAMAEQLPESVRNSLAVMGLDDPGILGEFGRAE